MTGRTMHHSEAQLRAALTTLAERWEQVAAIGPEMPDDFYIEPLTPEQESQYARSVTYRKAVADIREVLRTGRIPHDLMTEAEEQRFSPETEAATPAPESAEATS